jgi:PAS domain S-box-containing protein
MSPDTAVAFLFAAFNLSLLLRGCAAAFRIGSGWIFVAGGISLIFLDRTHIPRDFNQAIFQQLGVYPDKVYPHMALATGVGFVFWGIGSICLTRLQKRFSASSAFLVAVCGTLIVTLSSLCLLTYFFHIPEQDSGAWANWIFRMATESAALFLWMGVFLGRVAWSTAQMHLGKDRPQTSLIAGFLTSTGLLIIFVVVNINLGMALAHSLRLRVEIARNFGSIKNVGELVAAVRETESGQRGFLLTGDKSYLDDYRSGLQRISVAQAGRGTDGTRWLHPVLDRLIDAKVGELTETIRLAQNGHNEAALQMVKTGRGLNLMAQIESEAARDNAIPGQFIARQSNEYQNVIVMVRRTTIASYGLALLLLCCAVHLFSKEIRRRARVEDALRRHEAELEINVQERTAELQASESRYRAMLEQSPFAVHVLKRDGSSAGVNPAFEKFFGVGTEALRGYNIWADTQPERQGTVEMLRRAFAGEAGSSGAILHDPVLSAGTALACSSAQPTWVEIIAYPVKSQEGEVREVVLLCLDVTAREVALAAVRESELNFRQLTNALPQLVWTAKPDGTIDYFNERWYEFTGFTRDFRQSWQSVLHPDDLGPCLQNWHACLRSREPHIFEHRLWDRSCNRYRWHVGWGVPVLTPSGEVSRWVGSLTDIHENKEAEQLLEEKVRIRTAELEKSYKLLQSKEEALRQTLAERDTLFREVHHRVKNNLQVISSLLRMHGNALSNQPVAVTALEEARRRVLSMAMIHERLYAHQHMDRIDFGEYTETLVRELMRSFALPDKKVESRIKTEQVELDVEQAIPCGLVLNELVTNALKYAFKERLSGLITVTLEQTGDNEIILAVADDGVGLPEGFNWKKSKSMGFPIVDILARQLDGTMTVESRAGLKVTIQFPRRALLERAA